MRQMRTIGLSYNIIFFLIFQLFFFVTLPRQITLIKEQYNVLQIPFQNDLNFLFRIDRLGQNIVKSVRFAPYTSVKS